MNKKNLTEEDEIFGIAESLEQTANELQLVIDNKNDDMGTPFSLVEVNRKQAIELAAEVRKTKDLIAKSSFNDDFSLVKGNLIVLIAQANDALMSLIALAKTSEHPKAYEVLGAYLKIVADINHQLLAMHRTKKELEPAPNKQGGGLIPSSDPGTT